MNEQRTGTDSQQSSRQVWGERLVAAVVGGLLTSGALLWTSEREMETRAFQVRTERETAVRNLQGQLLEILGDLPLSKGGDFEKVVFLGALHGNFSEQFDTRIVFEAYAEEVRHPVARRELRRLAERVARRQSQYIKAHAGKGVRCFLDWAAENNGPAFKKINIAGHSMLLRLANKPIRKWDTEDQLKAYVNKFENESELSDFIDRQLDDSDDVGADDVADVVEVALKMEHDEEKDFIDFLTDLFAQDSAENEQDIAEDEECEKSTEDNFNFDQKFELSYMDSPYIDNIWIPHEDGSADRIAVLLKGIDKCPEAIKDCGDYRVEVEILHFPDNLLLPVEQAPPEEVASGSHHR